MKKYEIIKITTYKDGSRDVFHFGEGIGYFSFTEASEMIRILETLKQNMDLGENVEKVVFVYGLKEDE